MTTSYAPDHASALADIRAAGAAVTFTRTALGYDETTGGNTPSASTVAGYAVRIPGDPTRYQRLGLVMSTHPTLLVGATTFGSVPAPGDTVAWGGVTYTVRDVEPLEPNGSAIISTVVVGL